MAKTKIWRIYPNGEVKNETHVLSSHTDDEGISRAGYDCDVEAWSKHNKEWRGGCAQIVQNEGNAPVILYEGSVNEETLQNAINTIT